jgi:hypothetical protein
MMTEVAMTVEQAAAIAAPLRELLERWSRTNSTPLRPDVLQLLDHFDACRRALEAAEDSRNLDTSNGLRMMQGWSVQQTAAYMNCSQSNVRKRLRTGSLEGFNDHGRWIVDERQFA